MSSAVVTGAGLRAPGHAGPGRRLGGLLRPALRGRARRPADLRRRRGPAAGTPSPARWTRTSAAGAPAPGWSATSRRRCRWASRRSPARWTPPASRRATSACSPSPPAPATPRRAWTSGWPATSACRRACSGCWSGTWAATPRCPAWPRSSDFVTARSRPAVLLCCELTSLHVQPAQPDLEQVVAHALFSDAAAAVVVEPGAGRGRRLAGIVARTDPSTADHMTWDVTDLGFRMGLSPRVPDVLARHVGGVVDELLDRGRAAGRGRRRLGGAPRRPADPRRRPRRAGSGRGADGAPPAGCSPSTATARRRRCCWCSQELADVDGPVVAMAFGPGLTLYAALLLPA